jgi:prophage maintenance system killer protein
LPNEPSWLPIEVVIEHNRLEAEASGGASLSARPGFAGTRIGPAAKLLSFGEEDIVVLAVVLMAIARAHAFEQANKRTAVEAMWHLLRLNGYDLAIEDSRPWRRRSSLSSSIGRTKRILCARFALSWSPPSDAYKALASGAARG